LWPNSPLLFAKPFGNSGLVEFSRIRVDSNADALTKKNPRLEFHRVPRLRIELPAHR